MFMNEWRNRNFAIGIICSILVSTVLPTLTLSNENPSPFIVGLYYYNTSVSLDPLEAYRSKIIPQVCEGLFRYNSSSIEMEPMPQLAVDMGTINGNNLSISLRNDVMFHDGSKFNASASPIAKFFKSPNAPLAAFRICNILHSVFGISFSTLYSI